MPKTVDRTGQEGPSAGAPPGTSPHDRAATALRRVGFGVIAACSVVFGIFVVGETLSDPGGLRGIGLIAAWGVPIALLVLLAWRRPRHALPALVALTFAVVALSVWAAADAHTWRDFENHHGPVRAVATFGLGAAVGVLGLKRTRAAGLMLLVLGSVPLVLAVAVHAGFVSLAAAALPVVLAGLLYTWSASVERTSSTRARAPSRPDE